MTRSVPGQVFSIPPAPDSDSVAAAFRSAMGDASYSAVAAASGVRRKVLYAIRDGHRGLRVHELLALPPAIRDVLLSKLLEPDRLAVVSLPVVERDAPDTLDDAELAVRHARRRLDGVTLPLNGHVVREQAADGIEACDEEIAALLFLRELFRVAVREGVLSTGRLRPAAGGSSRR